MTESPLITPSLKTIISQDALESLKLKLSSLNVSTGHQSEPSMYEKFLEFIIDISQYPNPSTYFSEIPMVSLFDEEFLEQNKAGPGNLDSIKTILVYVLQEDVLDSEDLEDLWRVMRQNTDTDSIVFEILSQSATNNIKEIFMKNIMSHLRSTPANEMKTSDYKMMSSIFETYKADQLFSKQFDSFWQAMSSSPKFDLVFDAFSKGVNNLIKEEKLIADNKKYLLEICIQNVDKEKVTLISIKLIRTLLESCPQTTEEKNGLTKNALLQFLCSEKDLLNKVIRELKSLIVKENDLEDKKTSQKIEMIQFIIFLIRSILGYSGIIPCNIITNLWEVGLIASDVKDAQLQMFLVIKKIIESRIDKDLDIEELIRFFKEKTCLSKDWDIARFTKEAFDCFRIIFVVVNQHIHNISEVRLLTSRKDDFLSRFKHLVIRENASCLEEEGDFLFQVDTLPHKLEGYTILWDLACNAEDQSVASKAKDLLVYLHINLNISLHSQVKEIREEFLCLCFRELGEIQLSKETSEHKIIRCLELAHSFMNQTNKDNPKRHKLHSELGKGELLTINLKSHEAYYYTPKRVIRVTSNTFVSDLICKSKQELKIKSFSLYLEEPNSKLVISDDQNTLTLGDLGITDNVTLFVKSRDLPQDYLILSDKTLNPQARLIFTKWFENFSDNQKMSPEQCADFVHSCTNDDCRSNDRRVVEVFAKYDNDKDNYLTLDNFLDFYYDACIRWPTVVWNNLLAHKEIPDLKSQKKKVELSAVLNVASLISSNKEYIQVLFSLLQSEDEIAVKALQLLNRLPTDPQTFADIVMLKGVRDILDSGSVEPDWSYVLDTNNIYKLFYCLNIVEYLMDSKRKDENEDGDDAEVEDVKRLWSQDSRLMEYKKNWFSDFVACGGAEHLNEVVGKLCLFKTNSTIETYRARMERLIEAIDKVHTLNILTKLTE